MSYVGFGLRNSIAIGIGGVVSLTGAQTSSPIDEANLLLEDGGNLLQEDSGLILLDEIIYGLLWQI